MINEHDTDTAHACGYNLGKVEERERIREQVEKWQDKALELSVDKGFGKATRDQFNYKYDVLQRVLDLIDEKKPEKK